MWISSPRFDYPFIIAPAFLSSALVLILYFFKLIPEGVSPVTWLILVVFIDVAHVWSTLYRTYLNSWGRKTYQAHLWLVPLSCYLGGVVLHAFGSLAFWRVLAYMAVFHFIRQQYGFFMIYKRKEPENHRFELFDKVCIYSATLIPVLIWHLRGQQSFDWFIKGDFFYFQNSILENVFLISGPLLLLVYFLKEKFILNKMLFSPKNLILLGTAFAWYLGIVFVPGDWSFTVTNVVSHGLPYFALIYIANLKEDNDREEVSISQKIPSFFLLVPLIAIGFIEEGVWDGLFWRDHPTLFSWFYLKKPIENLSLKSLLVPLLALPQATHYVLDGFIWKTPLTKK